MPLLILFLLSFVAAYLLYKDAAQRGMNAKGWCMFIVLTSLAGLPVYLLARKPKSPA